MKAAFARSQNLTTAASPTQAPPRRSSDIAKEVGAPMNRKLIRPDLTDVKEQLHSASKPYRVRKPIPPEQTNAESFYFKKQMDNRTRMVVKLKDGEEIRGTIEWYDRSAIKVNRDSEPNILLMKDTIKYMYKENEDKGLDED
jgi:sRNA-binding regulator protein Hfq